MRVSVCLALVLVCAALTACGSRLPDISEYGDTPITIAGLTETEFTVTPNELAKLDVSGASATGATEKSGTVRGVGPTLITFLAQYGKKPTDYKYIRFTANDEYRITLKGNLHGDDTVLLAIAGKNKPLPKSEQPLRLIIPDAESSQWIYGVVKIEFVAE
jgi:hypothetical protein